MRSNHVRATTVASVTLSTWQPRSATGHTPSHALHVEARRGSSRRAATQNMDMTLAERPSDPSPRGSLSFFMFFAKSTWAFR